MFAEEYAVGTWSSTEERGTMKISVGVAILVVILLIVFVF